MSDSRITNDDSKAVASTRPLARVIAIFLVVALLACQALLITSCNSTSNTNSATSTSYSWSKTYKFRNNKALKEHFKKHGKKMGYADAQAYAAGANAVINNPNSLHKYEKEDGDDVYYLQATDEIVFVSTDGYIRTYFNPGGIDYFNRQ